MNNKVLTIFNDDSLDKSEKFRLMIKLVELTPRETFSILIKENPNKYIFRKKINKKIFLSDLVPSPESNRCINKENILKVFLDIRFSIDISENIDINDLSKFELFLLCLEKGYLLDIETEWDLLNMYLIKYSADELKFAIKKKLNVNKLLDSIEYLRSLPISHINLEKYFSQIYPNCKAPNDYRDLQIKLGLTPIETKYCEDIITYYGVKRGFIDNDFKLKYCCKKLEIEPPPSTIGNLLDLNMTEKGVENFNQFVREIRNYLVKNSDKIPIYKSNDENYSSLGLKKYLVYSCKEKKIDIKNDLKIDDLSVLSDKDIVNLLNKLGLL